MAEHRLEKLHSSRAELPDELPDEVWTTRYRHMWPVAKDRAHRLWARADSLHPGRFDAGVRDDTELLIAAAAVREADAQGHDISAVPVVDLLRDVYHSRSKNLLRHGLIPARAGAGGGERWEALWHLQADIAAGELASRLHETDLPDPIAEPGLAAARGSECQVWLREAYGVTAAVVLDRLEHGQFAGPPEWDLDGIARPGDRPTQDTALYRTLVRIRAAAPSAALSTFPSGFSSRFWPELSLLRAPEAIGRSRHELTAWPGLRALLPASLDETVLDGDPVRLDALLGEIAARIAEQIGPQSRWHPAHHPYQDDHGPHTLSRRMGHLTDHADPSWAQALHQAATWHAPHWNAAAFYPVHDQALHLTGLIVYVLAAAQGVPAGHITAADIQAALQHEPFDTWLAGALTDTGHPPDHHSDPLADPLARCYRALTHNRVPLPGVEPSSDGTGASGPVLWEALSCVRRVLTAPSSASGPDV